MKIIPEMYVKGYILKLQPQAIVLKTIVRVVLFPREE